LDLVVLPALKGGLAVDLNKPIRITNDLLKKEVFSFQ